MKKIYNTETGNVTFRLKDSKSEKSTIILGTYLFKEFQINFSTGLKVTPSQWDNVVKTVTGGTERKAINQKLAQYKTSVVKAHEQFNEQFNRLPTKEELRTIVDNAKEGKELKTIQKSKKSFDDVFQEFMDLLLLKNRHAILSGQKPLHRSYLSSFNTMYDDLKDFASQNNIFLDIDRFDEVQCLEFQTWLIDEKELELSTIRTRIKRLSQVLKRSFEKGYTENRSYMRDEFSVKVPPTFHSVLTEPEIKILYEYDFSDTKRLEKVRDIFILACHTSLRYGDITRIESDHIDKTTKRINILLNKGSKTDSYKNVSFPFFGYAEEILKKYDYNIKQIAITNQNTNEYLKEVFKEIPYFKDKTISREKPSNKGVVFEKISFAEKITFHDSRRSFCTNRYMEGWELLEIWQYSGHTNEGVFKIYFKPTFEHEKIRQESIKQRAEKLQKADLQTKQIEELQSQLQKMKELYETGDLEQMGRIIDINNNKSVS